MMSTFYQICFSINTFICKLDNFALISLSLYCQSINRLTDKYRSVWHHIMTFNIDKNNVSFEVLEIHYHSSSYWTSCNNWWYSIFIVINLLKKKIFGLKLADIRNIKHSLPTTDINLVKLKETTKSWHHYI